MAIDPVSTARSHDLLAPSTSLQSRLPAQVTARATQDSGQVEAIQVDAAVASEAARTLTVPPDKSEIEDALAKVEKVVGAQASNLLFSIDEDSGRTIIKIVDSSTNETIRQIPSEDIISIAKALDKLQGLLLRDVA